MYEPRIRRKYEKFDFRTFNGKPKKKKKTVYEFRLSGTVFKINCHSSILAAYFFLLFFIRPFRCFVSFWVVRCRKRLFIVYVIQENTPENIEIWSKNWWNKFRGENKIRRLRKRKSLFSVFIFFVLFFSFFFLGRRGVHSVKPRPICHRLRSRRTTNGRPFDTPRNPLRSVNREGGLPPTLPDSSPLVRGHVEDVLRFGKNKFRQTSVATACVRACRVSAARPTLIKKYIFTRTSYIKDTRLEHVAGARRREKFQAMIYLGSLIFPNRIEI